MPLLVVLLLFIALLLLWVLLLPLSLWSRYRSGTARRRALPWVVKLNSGGLLISLGLFVPSMALLNVWWPGALTYATGGLGIGAIVGVLGLKLCQFATTPAGLFYTPNRWLVLSLILLVAARISMGFVEMWRSWSGPDALAIIPPVNHASLFAVAGLLLGHYIIFTWGLRHRLPPDEA